MKILLLATYFYPYEEGRKYSKGVQIASSSPEIAKKLSKRHEVSVIARRTEFTKKKSIENNVEVHRVRFFDFVGLRLLSWVLFAFLEMLKLGKDRKFDVVLCWDWSTALPAVLAKPFIKIPVICSLRNQSQAYGKKRSLKFPFYYLLEYFTFSHSDFIVYSSFWVKKTLDEIMRIRTQSAVLHHGIDTKKFNPKIKSNISKKLGLNGVVIGFFGRLVKVKGIDVLIKSFAKLRKDGCKASLLIVGEGPENRNLKLLTKELGIEKHTFFTGFVHRNQIPKYMKACDVIVLPSKAEGFSSAVLEAMAMGKVFVGTEVGGVPEIIENWKSGVKIKPENVDELYGVLKKLLYDKKLMKGIGRNAYKFIAEKGYDWDHYIKKWERVLKFAKSKRYV